MNAVGMCGGEGVEVGGAVGVARAGEEDGVGAGGDLFGEAEAWWEVVRGACWGR